MTDARLAPRLRERVVTLCTTAGPGWRRLTTARRAVAGALAAAALALALVPRADGVPVLVATTDLAAGSAVRAADLAVRKWPAELVPEGGLGEVSAAEGRVLAGPARAGEALTDVRFAEAGAAAGPDSAAVPVRLADAGVAGLLSPGRRVDVVTLGERSDQPVLLASDAVVLAVLPPESGARGRLVMVAMPRGIATRVAAAALAEQVTITLR